MHSSLFVQYLQFESQECFLCVWRKKVIKNGENASSMWSKWLYLSFFTLKKSLLLYCFCFLCESFFTYFEMDKVKILKIMFALYVWCDGRICSKERLTSSDKTGTFSSYPIMWKVLSSVYFFQSFCRKNHIYI